MPEITPQQAMQHAVQHHREGRLGEAEPLYRSVLEQCPDYAPAWHMLGVLAGQVGRPDVAVDLLGRAAGLDPSNAELRSDWGNALQAAGRVEDAIGAYRDALRFRPESPQVLANLGHALQTCGQLDEAIAACREALRVDPKSANAHNNLGNAYKDQGRIELALECYQRALTLEPGAPDLHSNLILAMAFHPGCNARAIFDECREWNRHHGGASRAARDQVTVEADPERRLRIGYVSADFRDHVVGHNLLPLLRAHDRRQFEIFCYSAVARPDAVTDQCRTCADVWRNIQGISDDRAAKQIRADGIDLLVDLGLHSAENRLPLFAHKPAPVQVSYLGYCGTTGLDAMDYRLSDPYMDPPGSDPGVYSEETIRLPHTYWCYEPRGTTPEVSALPALAAGGLTFGCLNNFAKVSAPALDLWSGLLREVPESRLLLHAPDGSCRDGVTQRFARQGVAADRVEFVSGQSWERYIETYGRIDVALDPFPYSGGITTCDALWMGVPVVTLSGQTPVGRGGRSILSNIGLSKLVAETPTQYVEIAMKLAGDRPRLAELRASLRQRMENSPLRNAPAFAKDVENAFREMWGKWRLNLERNR